MPKPARRVTPFQRWYTAHCEISYSALAVRCGCVEGSIRAYLQGRSIPRPPVLRKLTAITGLPSDAFLFPFEWKPAQAHEAA